MVVNEINNQGENHECIETKESEKKWVISKTINSLCALSVAATMYIVDPKNSYADTQWVDNSWVTSTLVSWENVEPNQETLYVPSEVLLWDTYEIHKYLSKHLGIEINPEDIVFISKPEKFPYWVVLKWKETYFIDNPLYQITTEIDTSNVEEIFLSKLISRESDPTYIERYKIEIQNILENFPEISDNLISSLNLYFAYISTKKQVNPYIVERWLTTILTIVTKLKVDPELDKTTDLAFASDIYYLASIMWMDTSRAVVLNLKWWEKYTAIPVDKDLALSFYNQLGISFPISSIESISNIYEQYVYALNNREARNQKQEERNKVYAEKTIARFGELSMKWQIQVLKLYEAWKTKEMWRGMDDYMLASQVTQLLAWIEILVWYLNWNKLNFDTDLDIVWNSKMLVTRAPWTSAIITPEYISNLSKIDEYVDLKQDKVLSELRRLNEMAKVLYWNET